MLVWCREQTGILVFVARSGGRCVGSIFVPIRRLRQAVVIRTYSERQGCGSGTVGQERTYDRSMLGIFESAI